MLVNGFSQTHLVNIRLNLCSLSLRNILHLFQIIFPVTSVQLMLNLKHILGVRPLERYRGLFFLITFLLLLLHHRRQVNLRTIPRRSKQLPQLPHMVPIRLPPCQIMPTGLYRRRRFFQQILGPTAHAPELVDKVYRFGAVDANRDGRRIAALGRKKNARAVADLERKVGLRVVAEYVQQVVVALIGIGEGG